MDRPAAEPNTGALLEELPEPAGCLCGASYDNQALYEQNRNLVAELKAERGKYRELNDTYEAVAEAYARVCQGKEGLLRDVDLARAEARQIRQDAALVRAERDNLAHENTNLRVQVYNLQEQVTDLEAGRGGRVQRALRAFWEELVA